MKRMAFFFFILLTAAMMGLPGPGEKAARGDDHSGGKAKARELAIMKRKMVNPHEGIIGPDRVDEISRATNDVAQSLPAIRISGKIEIPVTPIPTAENLIDREIFGALTAKGIAPAQPATDEEFCRRIFLDLTGRQPEPERLLKYVADKDPAKKDKLITELIGSEAYINRWTFWIGDLVRSYAIADDRRDRNAEYSYLRDSIAKNKPFNLLAKEMITYVGRYDSGPGGFLVRPAYATIVPQDAYDELAAETVRTFLGTQAICVSCHDGEGHLEQVNLYFAGKKRADFWGLSSFYARTDFLFPDAQFRNISIRNKPDGIYSANTRDGMRPPRNGGDILPSYGLFKEGKPDGREEPRTALARLITSDPQFARAFANRVFAHFFTLGLVEPLDGFDLARLDPKNPPPAPWDLQPSHPVLLNELGQFFQSSGYDMRALIKLIVSSKAYALSARYDEAKWKPEYTRLYARKLVRQLEAEEVLDAITASTLVPGIYVAVGFDKPFNSVMALPGVEEPTYVRGGPQPSDDPFTVYLFLENFGRGDRNTRPRTSNSSITQALGMFNSDLLISRLESQQGLPAQLALALQQGKAKPEEAITYLYLATIGRLPSPVELDRLNDRITSGRQSIADLQWALFNRLDFLYNY